ncbi:hypothetical protein E0H22_14855 [Rhodopseudomonas boonkerdii]|nr:hypothetical protein E0H22_14855 [Rhodopseudomonas boonkerdii]
MVFAFDALGYTKRLRDAGLPGSHAEAHAEAARDSIMTELAIRSDLLAAKSELKSDMVLLRTEFMSAIDAQTLRLTVRLGGMVIAGVGVIVASIGVLAFLLRSH